MNEREMLAHILRIFFWSMWPLALLIVSYGYLQARIDAQVQANRFVEVEIAKIDKVISQIRDLQDVKRSVLERMEVAHELDISIANQMQILKSVTRLPASISLEALTYKPNYLLLKGRFESQAELVLLAQELESISFVREAEDSKSFDVDYKTENGRFSMEMGKDPSPYR